MYRPTASLRPALLLLLLAAVAPGCGDTPAEPESFDDFRFVIGGPAGIAFSAETDVWAREGTETIGITATHAGELTDEVLVLDANEQVRAALEGGTTGPPPDGSLDAAHAEPRVIVVGDREATVLGMELIFFHKSGPGTVVIEGRVGSDVRIRRTLELEDDGVAGLRLGTIPSISARTRGAALSSDGR